MSNKLLDTDKLYQAYPKINEAIDNAENALYKSTNAVNTANSAETKANSIQTQFDGVVLQGSIDPETAQARVDLDGVSYPTLKSRIDAEQEKINDRARKDRLPYFDVRDFGASTSSTDNSEAINSAIQAAYNAGGGKVYIPAGEFIITSSLILKEKVSIEGSGMVYRETGGTIIRCQGDISAIKTGLVDADTSDMRSLILSNFLVVGDKTLTVGTRTGYGLSGSHLRYNVVLFQVGFKYFKDGIHLSEAWTADFYKVLCNYNDSYGIYIENAGNRLNFYGCEMNNNGVNGFRSPSGTFKKNQGLLFSGCLFERNTSHGIQLNGTQNVQFNSNYFEGNGGYNLYLRGMSGYENHSVTLEGNRFYGTASAATGINIGDFTYNVTIGGGNYFENFTGSAIRLVSSGNQNVVIMPNAFINCTKKLEVIGTSHTPLVIGKAI